MAAITTDMAAIKSDMATKSDIAGLTHDFGSKFPTSVNLFSNSVFHGVREQVHRGREHPRVNSRVAPASTLPLTFSNSK